jgi:hypothetical protein
VLGQTLYLLHLLTAYYAWVVGSPSALLVSLAAGAAVVVTAKFGNQVLLFFGGFFAVFVSPWYMLLLAGCLLAAVAFSGARAWRVLEGQVRHSIFYARHLQAIFLRPHVRTFQQYRLQAGEALRGLVRSRDGTFARWYYSEAYYPHVLVTVYPQFLWLPVYIYSGVARDGLGRFLVVWMGAAASWFLLTKWRPLLFLGEGERYLEYGLFPALFLSVQHHAGVWGGLTPVFLVYGAVSAVHYLGQYQARYAPLDREFVRTTVTLEQFNALPSGVVMPIGSFHYQMLHRSRFPVLTHGSNVDERLLPWAEFELIYGHYPYPSARFSEILNRYHVAYIVSDPAHLKHYLERILDRSDEFDRRVQIMWETPSLIIGRVTHADGSLSDHGA